MFENETMEVIRRRILEAQGGGISTLEGSFSSDQASPVALELEKLYGQLDAQRQVFLLDTSDGDYVTARAAEFGIYRKPGTKAAGEITVTGTAGASLPAGSGVVSAGGLLFVTTEPLTLTEGSAGVPVEAAQEGEKYNLPQGSIVRLQNPRAGITSVTNGEPFTGGADEESTGALRERLLTHLQKPATSGNVYHYRQWALETPGVGAAAVFPLWNGNGTVKVVLASPDFEGVDSAVVQAAAAHIEDLRPIGATVTVAGAAELAISVSATITVAPSTTAAAVKEAFSAALKNALAWLVYYAYREAEPADSYTLLYSRVAYLLMDTDGVTDYSDLLVNGGTGNVTIPAASVPVVGSVTLHG